MNGKGEIHELRIVAEGDILLENKKDDCLDTLPFSALLPYWDYATEEDFEYGSFRAFEDRYILGIVTVASMQGGVVFI